MKAISFTQKGVATLAEAARPALLPGHALLRIQASGLCHTDIDVLHARYGDGTFPITPGHEFAGIVEDIASDVTGLAVGARVVADPNLPCGACRSCRKGMANLCRRLEAYGVTQHGGFADYALVRADHLHEIGTLPFHVAALAEPLACVLNGLRNAGLAEGTKRTQSALVFGAGPIGLLLALSLKACGVPEVAVADINEARLGFAADMGLTALASGSGALKARKQDFDLVADATGIASVVEETLHYTADGGTVMVFGVCQPEAQIALRPFEIFRRQIKICGSHSLNGNIAEALSVIEKDPATMARVVSHQLPLEEILPFLSRKPSHAPVMKVQFVSS